MTQRRCRAARAAGIGAVALVLATVSATRVSAATPAGATTRPDVDLTKDKTLYVVGYAHLDTQWRWSYPQVVREFVRDTLRNNFPLIEKYPHYVFNFSGSRRYEMMREYYPEDYAKLKEYVAAGRWFPCGSSVDENDANVPSAESQIRHVLYGNRFFKKEFGVTSDEFMLPDCFGFPYALPSILAHCGIKGFSTQKLTWGSAVGIPFKVGVWEGPDGKSVVAALDPGSYTGTVTENLASSESWLKRIEANGKDGGVLTDYHYYGTGDRGGAPAEESVAMVEKAATTTGVPIHVISAHADWLFNTITPEQREKLPRYKGELLLTQHSAGSITSQAHMKRWNRKNELLADAAEKASVAAMWLGAAPYPAERIYNAWDLVLGSQMHDMLPGTSLPKAYEYCWNDELLALNQFAAMTTDAVGGVAASMDTRADGTAVVVYNPLSIDREDVVEADVPLIGDAVRVIGPDGKDVPAQVVANADGHAKVLFLATVPSIGFATFDVRPGQKQQGGDDLKVTESSLENARYRLAIDKSGDVSSVFDKKNNREVLSGPARLAFQYENPSQYPAWNMDWDDQRQPPRGYVDGPAKVRVVENGPVRVAIEIERESRGSRFVQRVRLSKGSDHVEFDNTIDWRTKEHALKAVFPMAVANPKATYDIQLGAVERENNNSKKYEFPHHQWLDLTATDGSYGASVLSESKYGSDKPDDKTVRLTLLYTPGVRAGYQDQGTQDIGRHDFKYALSAHDGDWVKGNTAWEAARLNQPPLAFRVAKHEGKLGKSLSLLRTSSTQVIATAVKKAEDSDEIIVRLRNLTPTPAENVAISSPQTSISGFREVDGQEHDVKSTPKEFALIGEGKVVVNVPAYSLTSVALKLAPLHETKAAETSTPVDLPFDTDVVSARAKLADGAFDADGRTYAAEIFPTTLACDAVTFKLGPTADGQKNALACHAQQIALPEGSRRIYVLAAASKDTTATFKVGEHATELPVQSWTGYVGQWDNRLWHGDVPEITYDWHNAIAGLVPGYVKPAEVAWFGSHRHHPKTGDEHYQYTYLYKYALDVPEGARSLTLPDAPDVKVFAVSVTKAAHDDAVAASPLHDELKCREVGAPTFEPASGSFADATTVAIVPPLYYVDGELRYTTDGSDPAPSSEPYDGPIPLSAPTTIKAAQFISGHAGPIASARLDVNDVSPPRVTNVTALGGAAEVRVSFSEPVDKSAAGDTSHYKLDPSADVASAAVADDGRAVTLRLAKPLPAAKSGAKYALHVTGVTDASPKKNATSTDAVPVSVLAPVYRLDKPAKGPTTREVAGVSALPVKASDPWTLNLLVKMSRQPGNQTLIAGFGSDKDQEGQGRFLAKFGNGIHFWSSRRDVETNTPVDLNAWQMITVTYDGSTVRVYKNAQQIGQGMQKFNDDEPVVRLFPVDPWDHKRHFSGEVRDLTIWPGALPKEALEMLWQSAAKE